MNLITAIRENLGEDRDSEKLKLSLTLTGSIRLRFLQLHDSFSDISHAALAGKIIEAALTHNMKGTQRRKRRMAMLGEQNEIGQ